MPSRTNKSISARCTGPKLDHVTASDASLSPLFVFSTCPSPKGSFNFLIKIVKFPFFSHLRPRYFIISIMHKPEQSELKSRFISGQKIPLLLQLSMYVPESSVITRIISAYVSIAAGRGRVSLLRSLDQDSEIDSASRYRALRYSTSSSRGSTPPIGPKAVVSRGGCIIERCRRDKGVNR